MDITDSSPPLLLGTALVMLVERPILAGVLIGCLAYKPQFGLLIPLVLIAGSHWRAFIFGQQRPWPSSHSL